MPLHSLDIQILNILNSLPVIDPISIFLSIVGEWLLWALVAVILLRFVSKETTFTYLCMVVFLFVLVFILKSQLMHPRPEYVRYVLDASGYSMPSGHSAAAFATAVFLDPIFNKNKYRYLIWSGAILMALSRVAAGVHYPSDVMAGATLGVIVGYLWSQGLAYYQKNRTQ